MEPQETAIDFLDDLKDAFESRITEQFERNKWTEVLIPRDQLPNQEASGAINYCMKLAKNIVPGRTEGVGKETIAKEPVEDQSWDLLLEFIGIGATPYPSTYGIEPIHTIQRILTEFENRRNSNSKSTERLLREVDDCLRDILDGPMNEKVCGVDEIDLTNAYGSNLELSGELNPDEKAEGF